MTIAAQEVEFEPQRYPITVEKFHRMAEIGIFEPDNRVELIEGEIFEMSPIGSPHARCVKFLNHFLSSRLGDAYIIGIQDPIVLNDDSEPQPDVTILKYQSDFYKDETPAAADTLLVIEVADSSLEFDRNRKFLAYAGAGIAEAWLVDLVDDRVEVHSVPKATGYGQRRTYTRGEAVTSLVLPGMTLTVDEILG